MSENLKRVSLNISRKCNLSCPHCLSSSGVADPDELTTEDLFGLIDQLSEAGKPTLAIGVGEPLMRMDLFEVLTYAKEKSVPASIVSNGIFINERMARKLNDMELTSITVSIDGLEKNHEFVRGKGNFEKTLRGIRILRRYVTTVKLHMRVTVNTTNLDDCPDLIRLAEELKLDSIRVTPVLPIGRAIENQYLLLSQKQYLEFLAACHEVETSIKVTLPDDKPDPETFRPGEFGNHCGKEVCWITQTGQLYPCIFYGDGYLAGNIKEESFAVLWERAKKMSMFSGNEHCNTCEIYKDCRGGCRCKALWQYGDINAVDPYCPLGKNKQYEETIPSNRIPLHAKG